MRGGVWPPCFAESSASEMNNSQRPMNLETLLEIQAYADGELSSGRVAEIERLLVVDPRSKAQYLELVGVRDAIQEHEAQIVVPETREFFWSQIQRRIAQAEKAAAIPVRERYQRWNVLRWFAPVLALAAVLVVVSVRQPGVSTPIEVTTVTFHSDVDGVTFHWLD